MTQSNDSRTSEEAHQGFSDLAGGFRFNDVVVRNHEFEHEDDVDWVIAYYENPSYMACPDIILTGTPEIKLEEGERKRSKVTLRALIADSAGGEYTCHGVQFYRGGKLSPVQKTGDLPPPFNVIEDPWDF
jgi:hypothetical protein